MKMNRFIYLLSCMMLTMNCVMLQVRLVLKNSQGAEYVYIFDKNSDKYALELTNLTSDSYQYKATVVAAGNEYVRNGNITIMPLPKLNSAKNKPIIKF